MHAGRGYHIAEFLVWTRWIVLEVLVVGTVPTLLYVLLGWTWLALPWLPVALVGTAAAFIVGFKNNATYDRMWEARQIWGNIVNNSRGWGILVRDNLGGPACTAFGQVDDQTLHRHRRILINRHLAWLAALRHQLRQKRVWENLDLAGNREYRKYYSIPEHDTTLETLLAPYLSAADLQQVMAKHNPAAQLLALQSQHLEQLQREGLLGEFPRIEIQQLLLNLYEQQGRCERIKDFPYPRQNTSINLYFIRLFTWMTPLGMLQEFDKMGDGLVWLTIPFSALVSWVFISMEKIGESSANPFEGSANDIPMTAMSRNIEIDLLEMLGETAVPEPLQPVNHILM